MIWLSVEVPDVNRRTEILEVRTSNVKFADDASMETIAKRTPGFRGADLANMLNEAVILTGRQGKTWLVR